MSYISVNLFSQRDRGHLEPDDAVKQLQSHFPEAVVRPEDQLAFSAQRAETTLDKSKPAHRAVVEKLSKDAQNLGPAYAFHIPGGSEPPIEGVIKRYQADFHSDTPLSAEMRTRVITFLRSLVPPGVTIPVCEEPD